METRMMAAARRAWQGGHMHAAATFEITEWDQTTWDDSPCGTLDRARVTKRFSGDVEGSSVAEVLLAVTTTGPAAYTAQERFTGTFAGRQGSFLAQHGATTFGDTAGWVILGGSGAGELEGISGSAALTVGDDGSHAIVFDYAIKDG